MARETVAQRKEREALVRQMAEQAERDEYPANLMALLERVTTEPTLTLTVANGFFNVEDRNDRYRNDYVLSYSWSNDAQTVLEDLAYKVDSLEEERVEAERKYQVKKAALAKLSEEERELLGLE